MSESQSIDGPAGALEARLTGSATGQIAVLCHPHPLYGGSMDDGVLGILADALAAARISALRFNFRGVGASAGRHDGNGGEAEDLAAVIAWIRAHHPEAHLLLGGYSFGASTVCQLLADRLLAEEGGAGFERVLLVAPPVGNLPVPPPDGRVPVDVFAGDADPFIDQAALGTWENVSLHILPGADHFFGGAWNELQVEIAASLHQAVTLETGVDSIG